MIKFGIQIAQEGLDYPSLKRIALGCEKLGFDSIWLYDHFYPLSPPLHQSILESWTALTALALETRAIRLGTLVTCNLFRHPSVLAKMSATIDIISGGRLEFGIGAGWYKEECLAYGIQFPKASVRIRRLKESVQIIKKMWTEGRLDFEGRYYRIRDAICEPKPVQKPHPPVWIGGKGEKLLLKVVAELGDYCNFSFCTPDEFRHKTEVLDKYCLSVGREISKVKKSLYSNVLIAVTERKVKRMIEKFAWKEVSTTEYVKRNIIGTPKQVSEGIEQYVDEGVSYFTLYFPDIKEIKPLSIFAHKVMPSFRERRPE